MNWLTNVVRPKIRNMLRRETPENLWIKCPDSGQLVFYKDVEANQFVIPGSNYHMRMGAAARLKSIFDNETWYDIALPEVTADPLKFRDERKYVDRLKDARAKTGMNDAVKVGYGKLEGAVNQARAALVRAGVPEDAKLQFAADAGYWSENDLSFALRSRDWADILVAEPGKENGHEDRPRAHFGRDAFELNGATATCPAGTQMRGPFPDANGRLKWIGVGCAECPEKPRCTPGRERALTVSPAAEAMRGRLERKGARERYNRRIATVEPVFSAIEDSMGFRRVSSRLPETVRAEILLKILAHNVARLVTAKRVRCVNVLVDGF